MRDGIQNNKHKFTFRHNLMIEENCKLVPFYGLFFFMFVISRRDHHKCLILFNILTYYSKQFIGEALFKDDGRLPSVPHIKF